MKHIITIIGLLVLFLLGGCDGECSAQVYKLEMYGQNGLKNATGSATCVGGKATETYPTLLLTNNHNFDSNVSRVEVTDESGRKVIARRVRRSLRSFNGRRDDVAVVEVVGGSWRSVNIAKDVSKVIGMPVSVCGFGPESYGFKEKQMCFRGTVSKVTKTNGTLVGENGDGSIPGDSGGAVYLTSKSGDMYLLGLIQSYSFKSRNSRDTGFVPAEVLCANLQQWYGSCPQCQPVPMQPQQWNFTPQARTVIPRQVIPRQVIPFSPAPIQQPKPVAPKPSPPPAAVDPKIIRKMVQEEMAKLPRPKDGNRGLQGETGKTGPAGKGIETQEAVSILSEIYKQNPPQPGKDATSEQIQMAVDGWMAGNAAVLRGDDGTSVSREDVASMVREMFDANKTQLVTLPDREEIDRWNKAWIESNGATLVQRLLENPAFRDGVKQMLQESGQPGAVTMTSFEPRFADQDSKIDEIRKLVAKLPRSIQPMYADKDGKLKPFRKPLEPNASGVVQLPPSPIHVVAPGGLASDTQVVVGAKSELKFDGGTEKVVK